MNVDVRRIPKTDRRHCHTCKALVGYFTGPQTNATFNVRSKHTHPHTRHHSYYYCNACCPEKEPNRAA